MGHFFIRTHTMRLGDVPGVELPKWEYQGDTWKIEENITIVAIQMLVSILPLGKNNWLPGFSHGIAEVSQVKDKHYKGLLVGQVYYTVLKGTGVSGTCLERVSIVYPEGTGVDMKKGSELYLHMLHEVYASDPKETIYEAIATVSYVEE